MMCYCNLYVVSLCTLHDRCLFCLFCLLLFLGICLVATQKPIPAGPLLGLSICALAVFISAYLQDSP